VIQPPGRHASRAARRIGPALIVVATLAIAPLDLAQPSPRSPLLQIEVGDSVGLPLPDAKMEVFNLMDGAAFREWVTVEPNELAEGEYLLRVSNPGYRSAVLSVPLRKGTRVSLRVRLGAERDTTRHTRVAQADEVHSIGIVSQGRATTDLMRGRRVLFRESIERASPASLSALLRDAKGFNVVLTSTPDGGYDAGAVGYGNGYGCPLPVLINGDRRRTIPFGEANQRYGIDVVEAIELVPRASARLYGRLEDRWECGVLLIWVKQG
jgi:hypothetical protein